MRALRPLAGLMLLAALGMNLAWIARDNLVRDGDEEGHVGAAELFLDDLRGGRFVGFARRAVVEDMGDYPSLYPAAVGGWWWLAGGGLPGRLAVRGFNLAFLGLAAAGVWGAARRRVGAGPALVGAAAVAWLPLGAGVARHFMPEGALAAAVALSVAAAEGFRERPGAGRAALLGLALACGLLTKQTFPLYAAAPVGWSLGAALLGPRRGPAARALLLALPTLALAAPWYAGNLAEQLSYTADSAGYRGDAGALEHLLYYPRALGGLALGPVWAALAVLGGVAGWLGVAGEARDRRRRLVALGAVWLLGGLLLLTAVPKKYDRLLVPLLPAAGLLVAAGAAARPRFAALGLAGAGWTAWLSWAPTPLAAPPQPVIDFEPGCIQTWLRPPEPRGLGLEAVAAAAAQAAPGHVRVLGAPPIPCSVQTTFGWDYHLGPYLRRAGQDRDLEIVPPGEAPDPSSDPAITVDFDPAAPGQRVAVPLLNDDFALRWISAR